MSAEAIVAVPALHQPATGALRVLELAGCTMVRRRREKERSRQAGPGRTEAGKMGPSSENLLSQVRNLKLPVEQRCSLLEKLAASQPAKALEVVKEALAEPTKDWKWTCLVMVHGGGAAPRSENERRELTSRLLTALAKLRRDSELPPTLRLAALGAGFRRFALSAPVDQADQLADYIQSDADDMTRRACVATRILFSNEAPSGPKVAEKVKGKVQKYIEANLGKPESDIATVSIAIVAAASLNVPGLAVTIKRHLGELKKGEVRFITQDLEELKTTWASVPQQSPVHASRLEGIRDCLDVLASGSKTTA